MSRPHSRLGVVWQLFQISPFRFFLTVGMLLTVPALTWAETGFEGTVRDPSGAAVGGAVIRARAVVTGKTTEVTADADGRFRLTGLAPGAYWIEVVETSFEDYRSDITLLEEGQLGKL